MKKIYLFVLFSALFFACKEKKSNTADFQDISSENIYHKVVEIGKDTIPTLINFIDTNYQAMVGFVSPSSSAIYPFNIKNYIGITNAYLIEFILLKDSVGNVEYNPWGEKPDPDPYNMFQYGVIVKIEKGNPILNSLSYEDMKIIKKIYSDWWVKNKDKTIDVLRKEYKEGKHILDGSNYKWI